MKCINIVFAQQKKKIEPLIQSLATPLLATDYAEVKVLPQMQIHLVELQPITGSNRIGNIRQ